MTALALMGCGFSPARPQPLRAARSPSSAGSRRAGGNRGARRRGDVFPQPLSHPLGAPLATAVRCGVRALASAQAGAALAEAGGPHPPALPTGSCAGWGVEREVTCWRKVGKDELQRKGGSTLKYPSTPTTTIIPSVQKAGEDARGWGRGSALRARPGDSSGNLRQGAAQRGEEALARGGFPRTRSRPPRPCPPRARSGGPGVGEPVVLDIPSLGGARGRRESPSACFSGFTVLAPTRRSYSPPGVSSTERHPHPHPGVAGPGRGATDCRAETQTRC